MREKACQSREEVHHLLTQAEATDTEEDGRYGADRRGMYCRRNCSAAKRG